MTPTFLSLTAFPFQIIKQIYRFCLTFGKHEKHKYESKNIQCLTYQKLASIDPETFFIRYIFN